MVGACFLPDLTKTVSAALPAVLPDFGGFGKCSNRGASLGAGLLILASAGSILGIVPGLRCSSARSGGFVVGAERRTPLRVAELMRDQSRGASRSRRGMEWVSKWNLTRHSHKQIFENGSDPRVDLAVPDHNQWLGGHDADAYGDVVRNLKR